MGMGMGMGMDGWIGDGNGSMTYEMNPAVFFLFFFFLFLRLFLPVTLSFFPPNLFLSLFCLPDSLFQFNQSGVDDEQTQICTLHGLIRL
ncbi:hypothetical protein F4809DRAFT_604240 [Biscogniauxia mediterranea]|nr:hypothetical protein F4809DRAFT_604240 [Biscogniauxia mediterranea]